MLQFMACNGVLIPQQKYPPQIGNPHPVPIFFENKEKTKNRNVVYLLKRINGYF